MASVSDLAPAGGTRWLRVAVARTVLRLAALGGLAVFLANLHLPWRPRTLDLLRGLTGIPCPFCGSTTAAVHLGHLDIVGALAANPFVVVAALVLVTTPLTGAIQRIERLTNRNRTVLAIVVLAAAEMWQLVRFGLLP